MLIYVTTYSFEPFKREPQKMVKHTQTIRWLLPTNCLGLFDHFVGLVLKGLKTEKYRTKKLHIVLCRISLVTAVISGVT